MQKFLLIGVGGSGGKTVRYLWREIRRRLKEADWKGDVPRAFQFVHIDCPNEPDVIEGDVPAVLEGADHTYLGLGKVPRPYRTYDEQLTKRANHLKALTGWRPDPAADIPPPYLGAGQRRSVGRVVGLSELDDVGGLLSGLVGTLGAQDVTTELQQLGDKLGFETKVSGSGPPITAIVVGSMGGGAGSGIFNDVVELLRSLTAGEKYDLPERIVTLLYAPDVFEDIPRDERKGVEPNSLAALSELVSGFEHQDALDEFEADLLRHGKGMKQTLGRRTARSNLIIGASNPAISYSTSHQVYQAMAKALAQYVVDADIRSRSEKYTINLEGKTVSSDFRITDLEGKRPCSSLGYANVSLGAALFGEYAQERLAKLALEKLLHGHRDEDDPRKPEREKLLIKKVLERETADFIKRCKLYELSTANDEVLDSLRNKSEVKGRIQERLGPVRRELEGRSAEQSPKNWHSALTGAYDHLEAEVMQEEQALRLQKASEWAGEVQTRVTNEVADALANWGFPVTKGLLEQMVKQLEKASAELASDANKLEQEAEAALSKIASAFNALSGVITPHHQLFSVAAGDRAERLFKHSEAELYRFTSTLLNQLVAGFFTGLRRTIADAEKHLIAAAGEDAKVVEQWSSEAVPPHLLPAPNELLLESHEEFPRIFDDLVAIDFEDGVRGAIREVVSRAWKRDDGMDQESLIVVRPRWQPAILGSRTAEFKLELDPRKLLTQAEAWVKHRHEGAITKFVRGDLNEWLSDKQPESTDRAARFANAFELALAAAAPLVDISPSAYEVVHNEETPTARPVISTIPIGKKHKAAPRVMKALKKLGLSEGQINDLLRPTISRSAVEISSFLPNSVYPAVFGSLMSPMLADWKNRKTPQDRNSFWEYRRAKPIHSFVPMSPARQTAFIRGWLTANLLGHVEPLKGPWRDDPLDIWTPEGRRPFPEYLLGKEVRRHGAVMPALLESLPLAILNLSTGELGEFESYVRVLALGSASDDGKTTGMTYEDANPELTDWMLHGRTTSASPTFEDAPTPPENLAGSASADPESRRDALLDALGEYLKGQTEVAEQEVTVKTARNLGRGWEVSRRAIMAAEEISRALNAIRIDDPDIWG